MTDAQGALLRQFFVDNMRRAIHCVETEGKIYHAYQHLACAANCLLEMYPGTNGMVQRAAFNEIVFPRDERGRVDVRVYIRRLPVMKQWVALVNEGVL